VRVCVRVCVRMRACVCACERTVGPDRCSTPPGNHGAWITPRIGIVLLLSHTHTETHTHTHTHSLEISLFDTALGRYIKKICETGMDSRGNTSISAAPPGGHKHQPPSILKQQDSYNYYSYYCSNYCSSIQPTACQGKWLMNVDLLFRLLN